MPIQLNVSDQDTLLLDPRMGGCVVDREGCITVCMLDIVETENFPVQATAAVPAILSSTGEQDDSARAILNGRIIEQGLHVVSCRDYA